MIYITGDTHGIQNRFIYSKEEKQWSESDTVIICGDFGFILTDNHCEEMFLDDLSHRPYTLCFVDGNHENFYALNKYPQEMWNGGKIHRIRHNIIHLMRGQVYNIEAKTFFTMGGGYSRDREIRKLNYSYWNEEMPNEEEYTTATENLMRHNNKVDYIITHTCPISIAEYLDRVPDMHELPLNEFFEKIKSDTEYKQWFFGHFHEDKVIDDRHRVLFYDIVRI